MRQIARMLTLPLLLGALGLLVPAPTRADDSEVRKQLETIYDQYTQSLLAKDTGPLRHWYEQHLAADALEISTENQRRNRQQILDEIQQAQKMWPLAKESTGKIDQITMVGGDAIVWFSSRVVRSVPDPQDTPASPHPPHEAVLLMSGRDTWVKGPDGWRCPLSVNLTFRATLDGKPLPLPGTTPPGPATEEVKPAGRKSEEAPAPSKVPGE